MPRRPVRLVPPGGGLRGSFAEIRAEIGVPEAFPADVLVEGERAAAAARAPASDRTDVPGPCFERYGSSCMLGASRPARCFAPPGPSGQTPSTMEASEEIRSVIQRFFEALRDGDEEAVGSRISRQTGFERYGSDPNEWWRDGDEAVLIFRQQMQEMGGRYPFELTEEPTGYREGSVGWGGFQAWVVPPARDEGALWRATFVLHLEHGDWKIVQAHSAIPVTNESQGFQLTTSVDEIAESVTVGRPDLSSASAPDGTVTIAFTDIEGSTRLNDFLGDQRWLEILRAHNDVVKGVTAEHGGTIVKGQGDGFMLAFPSARRALRCADGIERAVTDRFNDPGSMVRVRIGIHVGEAVREADDFFGHAVSYAARIANQATGGEVVVSSLVHDLLAPTGEFEFGEPRVVELKGISGAHRIFPLAGAVAG